jgi:ADP-heptose:LPS heptosyltransferase
MLRETAAILSLNDLYVVVDSGTTHIMSAFDIPLVGMYHCLSSSRLTGPMDHPKLYVIDHPRLDHDCTEVTPMAEIAVESVMKQVNRALREHPPANADRRHA